MNKDDCFQLGKITKLHGYKGAVTLFLDVDDPAAYKQLDGIFLDINNTLIPYFPHRFDLKGKHAVVHFEGITSESEAQLLVNKDAYLPLSLLPELSGKQFYFHEVVGFTLVDEKQGAIGIIEDITDHPSNPLFVTTYKEKQILLPMNDEVLKSVDREKREIRLSLPEGMLEALTGE